MKISSYKIIADNTIIQLLARLLSTGSLFFISIFLARTLGAEGFGDFSKIITYVPFFYLLVDLGLNASFLRMNSEKELISWQELFGLRLLISLVAVLLCLLLLFILPRGQTQGYTSLVRVGIFLYSFSIVSHSIITSTNALFQKKQRFDLGAFSLILGSLVSIVGIFLAPTSIITSVVILFLGTLSTALVSLLFARQFVVPIPSWNLSHIKLLIRDAAPLSLTLFFNLLYFRIDSVILTLSRSTIEVGAYNLAFKIFEFPLVLPIFFMNSLYPLLLKELKTPQHFKKTILQSALMLCFLGILATIIVWTCAPFLIIINPTFTNAVPLLRLLSLAFPVFFLSSLMMWTLIAKKRNRTLASIYGMAALINICSNFLFIPLYGPFAAAAITVIAETVVLFVGVLSLWSFRKE